MGQHRTPCNSFHKYPWTSPDLCSIQRGRCLVERKGSKGKDNKRFHKNSKSNH